ncbi:MAG: LysR family transcriptional regulator [Tenericutes bacterium]|nr:LysR family transcriptional regulator [Mycoplasmatota bacterium]
MEENENLVNLSLYKLFYLVCQNGSFSKTAKLLNLTQPSVSYNIKKLEDELGVTLFERGNNLLMTPAAEELLPYVEEALNSLRNGERKINDLINLKKGQITIGIPSHIGVFLLTDIIKKFSKNYPNIRIEVICKSTKELFRLLNMNELDILIDCSPLEENISEFVVKKIAREKCALACNRKNTQLLNRTVELKEIVNHPLIVPLETSSSTKSLVKIFKKYNVPFEPSYTVATSDMIAEMVEQEIGIGFLFEKTIEKYPNLYKIDLNCKFPEFDIFLLYKDSLLSTATQEFITFMNKKNI